MFIVTDLVSLNVLGFYLIAFIARLLENKQKLNVLYNLTLIFVYEI